MNRNALTLGPGIRSEAEIRLESWLVVFMRVLAVFYLGLSILSWAWAMGIWPDPDLRFDTVSAGARWALAGLCVLHPVATVGLWSALSWGRVVWLMAVIAHVAVFLSPTPGVALPLGLLLFDAVMIAIYLSLIIALRFVVSRT